MPARPTHPVRVLALALALAPLIAGAAADTADITPQQLEFFESNIRPVLVDHCYKCHSADAKKVKGDLLLDSLAGWQTGGESGPAIVPGDPGASLLVSALHYDKFEMPPKAKLPAETIADFEEWIEMGAPDPRAEATAAAAGATEAFDLESRKGWWSLQPLKPAAPPATDNATWPRTDTDRFVLAALEKKGWQPAAPATRTSWLRRVTYDLTGLPPTPDELDAFLADGSPDAHEKVVDRLLASPHFGEQWARHWMDLVRYAETKAFEADYPMPNVFRYRDYLIRAFNNDVPYHQLVREAIAGDLIEPRLDPASGHNESVVGPGYLYLTDGQHGPPDIHSDEARIFDDMIDVVGKAFLAKTLACARCHDHKFDAITTGDYYSLYGVIASSRIDYADTNPPAAQASARLHLAGLKALVHKHLADLLEADLKDAAADLHNAATGNPTNPQQQRWAEALKTKPDALTDTIAKLVTTGDPAALANTWNKLAAPPQEPPATIGGLTREGFGNWVPSGVAFGDEPRPPGDFVVAHDGDSAVSAFAGARPAAGHLASRFAGSVKSPDFTIAGNSIKVRARGKNARVSLYVRHYELVGRGPTTGGTTKVIKDDGWQTINFNTNLWVGERAYIEVQHNGGQINFKFATENHTDGSYAVLDAATNNTPLPPLTTPAAMLDIGGPPPATQDAAIAHVATRLTALADAWRGGSLTPAQGDLLAALFDAGVLDFSLARSEPLRSTVEAVRSAQKELPVPNYVRSLSDGHGIDEPVYIRGSHKNLSPAPNPRRFLDAIDPAPFEQPGSGRLQWADALVSSDNPLTPRVITNRVWHHLFGRGIVASVDDLGQMGDLPSHPELLDTMAASFANDGWSLKRLIRKLALSSTYRMSSRAHPDALRDDPDNTLLQHMPVRRLQAEAIRDTLLAVSGQLDRTLFGPSRGGDGGDRRSVYIQLKRRFMPEFLMTFDMPNATETFGRRNITASPAQSLAMMNSALVWKAADRWADRTLADRDATFQQRVDTLHRQAFGRSATPRELEWARGFLDDHNIDPERAADHRETWRELCHTMLNRKELIYVY